MNKNYRPLGDRVIVKMPEKTEKKTAGGIIINKTITRGETIFGEVLLVGRGIYTQSGTLIPMETKIGDMVMYKSDMSGDPIKIEGVEYLLFREHDLIMVNPK